MAFINSGAVDSMQLIQWKVGHGEVRLDGFLGYSDAFTNDRVALPGWVGPFDNSISAHATSDLVVDLAKPTDLCGALNAGANLTAHDSGPCEFWINDHWIGDLSFPCETTPWICVPPGIHRLRTIPTRRHWGAHTIWLARNCERAASGRLALVTIGCYPLAEVKKHLYWLYRSAARVGLLVHAFGIDSRYYSHYQSKIERLDGWLDSLPACYDKVLYLDGRDTFVTAGETELAGRLRGEILISGEPGCWPDRRPEWAALFHGDTDQIYPNAGMWAGDRVAVREQFDRIRSFHRRCSAGHRVGLLRSTSYFDNDQHLWQACMAYEPCKVETDTRMNLFCTLAWIDANIEGTGRVRPDRHGVATEYDTRPACLHFPGGNTEKMGYWARWLGL
jgi:hypothetical protein